MLPKAAKPFIFLVRSGSGARSCLTIALHAARGTTSRKCQPLLLTPLALALLVLLQEVCVDAGGHQLAVPGGLVAERTWGAHETTARRRRLPEPRVAGASPWLVRYEAGSVAGGGAEKGGIGEGSAPVPHG